MYKLAKKIADIAYHGECNKHAYCQEFNGDIYFTVDDARIFRIKKELFTLYYNMNVWEYYKPNDDLVSMFFNNSEFTHELKKAGTHKIYGRVLQMFTNDNEVLSVTPEKIRDTAKCRIKHVAMKYLRNFTNRNTRYFEPDRVNESWRTPLFLEQEGYKYLMILPVVV